MVEPWLVSLELTRDDGGALDDEGLRQLNEQLANTGVNPVLSRPDPGTVLVKLTVDARNDMEARGAAEHVLREKASTLWSALGLPPFTIAALATERADDD